MTRAYSEILADKAADSMGRMLDFSVHSLHIKAGSILNLFTASGTADLFGHGDIRIICGMSGIELAYEILETSGIAYDRTSPRHTMALSPEYWCGFMLARIQWSYSDSFAEILSLLSPDEMTGAYKDCRAKALSELPWDAGESEKQSALSEAAADYAGQIRELYDMRRSAAARASSSGDSALKKMRIKNGLSQSELAGASGVPLRTIQQYEQRQKNINRARAEYLLMLSSALNCDARLILER